MNASCGRPSDLHSVNPDSVLNWLVGSLQKSAATLETALKVPLFETCMCDDLSRKNTGVILTKMGTRIPPQ